MSQPMVPNAIPRSRFPFGLPAGSVRAVLSLMIAGLFWTVLVLAQYKPNIEVPLFLYFLTGMILLFFGGHGHSISHVPGDRGPLGMPRGSIRALLLVGSGAILGWMIWAHGNHVRDVLTPDPEKLRAQWLPLLATTIGGYVAGYLIGRGPWRYRAAFQDLLAWVSILAMLGLIIETLLVLVISPSTMEGLDLGTWEAVLTTIVAFYFGARS